jgi:hypothetical protein
VPKSMMYCLCLSTSNVALAPRSSGVSACSRPGCSLGWHSGITVDAANLSAYYTTLLGAKTKTEGDSARENSVYSLCTVDTCQATGAQAVLYAILSRKTVRAKCQQPAFKLS